MSRLYLKFPTLSDKEKVLDFKNEFILSGQKMAGVAGLDRLEKFEDWLSKITRDLKQETCDDGKVPSTLYLSFRGGDNKLVGIVQVRHKLNQHLLDYGGNIGDCIRPSEQGKGYGTEQIALALEKCRELKMEMVLITCFKSNIASARTIQKNNGILENEVIDTGELKQRYWIKL